MYNQLFKLFEKIKAEDIPNETKAEVVSLLNQIADKLKVPFRVNTQTEFYVNDLNAIDDSYNYVSDDSYDDSY